MPLPCIHPIPTDDDLEFLQTSVAANHWEPILTAVRRWLDLNCPRYMRDELEGIVATWTTGWAVRWRQLTEAKLTVPNRYFRAPPPPSPEEAAAELKTQMRRQLSEQLSIYARTCHRWDNPEPAEARLARTLLVADRDSEAGKRLKAAAEAGLPRIWT